MSSLGTEVFYLSLKTQKTHLTHHVRHWVAENKLEKSFDLSGPVDWDGC